MATSNIYNDLSEQYRKETMETIKQMLEKERYFASIGTTNYVKEMEDKLAEHEQKLELNRTGVVILEDARQLRGEIQMMRSKNKRSKRYS